MAKIEPIINRAAVPINRDSATTTELTIPPAPVSRMLTALCIMSFQLISEFSRYVWISGISSRWAMAHSRISSITGGISSAMSRILETSSGTTRYTTPVIIRTRARNDKRMHTGRRSFRRSFRFVPGNQNPSILFNRILSTYAMTQPTSRGAAAENARESMAANLSAFFKNRHTAAAMSPMTQYVPTCFLLIRPSFLLDRPGIPEDLPAFSYVMIQLGL